MNDDWKPEDDWLTGLVGYVLLGCFWLLLALLERPLAWFFSFCQ